MIDEFVAAWEKRRNEVEAVFFEKHPEEYIDVVRAVVSILSDAYDYDYESPDPSRIHEINDGDYQGTLLYVVGANSYQPSVYWWVMVDYGSCSGCDALEGIRSCGDDPPTAGQVEQYMTLALHIVQKLKRLDGDAV